MSETENNNDLGESDAKYRGIINSTKKFIKAVFQAGKEYVKESNLVDNIRKKTNC
jgi:hypothetical protein